MKEGLKKLYAGDFNGMRQEEQADGSVIVTLSKRGEDKIYRFRVKDLYREHEEVLEHQASYPYHREEPKMMEQLPETNSWLAKTLKRIVRKLPAVQNLTAIAKKGNRV